MSKINCGNLLCPKFVKGCSVWDNPNKHVCKDHVGNLSNALNLAPRFGKTFGVWVNNYVVQAQNLGVLFPGAEVVATVSFEHQLTKEEQLSRLKAKAEKMGNNYQVTKRQLLNAHQSVLIEIEALEAEIKSEQKAKEKKLRLFVHNGDLIVAYGKKEYRSGVARIGSTGEFEALTTCKDALDTYNKWVEEGCRVDETPVSWKDREYKISEKGTLYSVKNFSHSYKDRNDYYRIYDFRAALPACSCKDPNIITTKHNNRVVIF